MMAMAFSSQLILAVAAALSVLLPQSAETTSTNSSGAEITIRHMTHSAVLLATMNGRQQAIRRNLVGATTSAPVSSGYYLADHDYYARLTVGSGRGSRDFYFFMDTASDLTWLQCEPCKRCYSMGWDDPVFDPSLSPTLTTVDGGSALCARLPVIFQRKSASTACKYRILYTDNNFSSGKLVLDTIGMASGQSFPGIAFGCSNKNDEEPNPTAGVLGLGRNYFGLSFQLHRQQAAGIANVFSYCFPPKYTDLTSTLTFGDRPIPPNTVFTPLITNPARPELFYYVELVGITVGGQPLVLPPTLFDLNPNTGKGGTILDTGGTISEIPEDAYNPLLATLRATISAHSPQLVPDLPYTSYDLEVCYHLQDGVHEDELLIGVPPVAFVFASGAQLEVPPDSVLVYIVQPGRAGADNRVCISFAKADDTRTIIGNIHQQQVRITIDIEQNRVGFTPNAC
ncbi:hypothetical protein L7F22_020524 [Adiantum nelumboides]|nr:hypothetical protein [Adiantum nelumboides]